MNILLSAYHCAPGLGSESAVGWNYAVQLRKLNHRVIVITSDTRKPFFADTTVHQDLGIEVLFFALPGWMKKLYKPNTASEHLYYIFWQIGLFFFCRKLISANKIDIIHHVTLGSFRTPSLLWLFKIPFVFGPVGGGEDPPASLFKYIKPVHSAKERFRKWMNLVFVLNPFYLLNLYYSTLILLKNKDTLRYIPKSFHHKCRIDIGIGVNPESLFAQPLNVNPKQKLKILYAGRLLYWKGIHLSIKALAGLENVTERVEFTIVGSGNDEQWLKELAKQQGVQDLLTWIPKVEQKKLFQMYQEYDLLVFPSFHDSSGMVVLEAMAYGMPVICLDVGGPKEIVDASCGFQINTHGSTEEVIVSDISAALLSYLNKPAQLGLHKENAKRKSSCFTWEKVVQRSYAPIQALVLNEHQLQEYAERPTANIF